jgi:hypothetical protein
MAGALSGDLANRRKMVAAAEPFQWGMKTGFSRALIQK